MNPAALHGKEITLHMIDMSDTNNQAVFTRTAHWDGSKLTVESNPGFPPFEIVPDWFKRIEPVPADLADMMNGADFFLTLRIGRADGVDASFWPKTGFRWPE